MRIAKYVSSFLVGLTVGAGVTLMFAPLPGRRMRRKLADSTDRVKDKLDDLKEAVHRVAG